MNEVNLDINKSNVVSTYLTDIGVAIVFCLGYYIIRYFLKGTKKTVSESKIKTIEAFWNTANTVDDFNSLIKTNEENSKMNPFEILETIRSKYLSPDINTYNNLLNSCFINNNFTSADKLIEEILEFGSPVQPDLSTFNIILKGLSCKLDFIQNNNNNLEAKKDLLFQADKYMEELSRQSIVPNDITINTMLDIIIKAQDIKRAWDLFDTMKIKYNVEPDKYSYSTIIKALKHDLDATKLERAFGILNYLKKQSVSGSDEMIFNCLIEICLKLKLITKAETVYKEMISLGVMPSKITYAIMIKGYGQAYNLPKAFAIFTEMKKDNIQPNDIIYGCLLNACVKCSNIEKANEVYEEIKSLNITMNLILYTTMIKAYTKGRNFDKALEVYQIMLNDSKVQPNIVIHNAMLDACAEWGNIRKMTEIYDNIKELALKDNESHPLPDLITYSTVIKGYARQKEMEKVFELYHFLQSKEEEFPIDEVVYNSILDGCSKTGKYKEAGEIYKEMKSKRVKCSNVTYSILIKLYANNNEPLKAFEILNEMKLKGIKPGIIVYTCLIQTSLKNQKFDKAICLFEQLKSEGLQPDYVLYNTIVNGSLYHSKWDSACKYMLESFTRNVKMAPNLYRNVLEKLTMNYCTLGIEEKCDYAGKIMKSMKEKNLFIEDDIYKKVSQMLYKQKNYASGGGERNSYYEHNSIKGIKRNYKN